MFWVYISRIGGGGKTPGQIDPLIFCGGRYPRRNHVFQIWWRSVQGLASAEGQILYFPIRRLSLQHYHTTSVWFDRAAIATILCCHGKTDSKQRPWQVHRAWFVAVDFIFLTDDKIFLVAPTVSMQNDRVYVPAATKKRDVPVEFTLNSTIVSYRTAVNRLFRLSANHWWYQLLSQSCMGCSGLVFVNPGAKINGS